MKRRQQFSTSIALTLIAGFTLSACGIRGELKTPPPVWGDDIRSEEQKAEDAQSDKAESGIIIQAPVPVE